MRNNYTCSRIILFSFTISPVFGLSQIPWIPTELIASCIPKHLSPHFSHRSHNRPPKMIAVVAFWGQDGAFENQHSLNFLLLFSEILLDTSQRINY